MILEPKLLAGRYEVGDEIGRGAHGIVLAGVDRHDGSAVAIKCLLPNVASDPAYNVRMLREAQVMAALRGTAAVRVHGLFGDERGTMYLVMDRLYGESLEDRFDAIEAGGERVSVPELFELLDPIVATLDAAHARGIVHRDLKPGNVFVIDAAHGGGVRLLDFGLAKVLRASPLTELGMIAGSPSYIAPEVWHGDPRVLDHRIDVYSFGAIVFRALAGEVPFGAGSIAKKLLAATSAPRPSLFALRPDLPPEVDAWVARILAIEPDERFSSMWGAWDALRAIVDDPVTPLAPSMAPLG